MNATHWSRMGQLWRFVGPPLRPSAQDIAVFQQAISTWYSVHQRPPRALILGVTPELHSLQWPTGTNLRALDSSAQMIEQVWPGDKTAAMVGSWTSMPLAADSVDVVVCDGGFGMLPYPDGQAELLAELRRVISLGGIFAVRLFTPRNRTGSTEQIFDKLAKGQIASLDALKLYLWGAMHGDAAQGVQPRMVVAKILEVCGDFDRLAADHGWALEHVRALELHLGSQTSYYLTEATEVIRMACSDAGGFELSGKVEPDYELGPCCPIVTLRRKG